MKRKFVVTTHLPEGGAYFIDQVARTGHLETVIFQMLPVGRKGLVRLIRWPYACMRELYWQTQSFRSRRLMRLGRFLPGYTLEHVVGHRLNDIRRLARRHGFKLVVTNSINSDPAALDALRHSEAEFLLVQGGRILKPSTLKAFKGIWLNGHGGYLPQYRGMHSEYWALKHRDYDRIGVSIHVLVVRLDGGPILQRSCISYDPREPYGDLLLRNHANLVSTYVEFVRRLAERPAGAGLSGFELIPNSPVGPCYSAPAGVDMMRLAATPAGEVR